MPLVSNEIYLGFLSVIIPHVNHSCNDNQGPNLGSYLFVNKAPRHSIKLLKVNTPAFPTVQIIRICNL